MKKETTHILASFLCVFVIAVMIVSPYEVRNFGFPATLAYTLYYGQTLRKYKDLPLAAAYLPCVFLPTAYFLWTTNSALCVKAAIILMLVVLCIHIINVKRIITHSQS